MRARAFGVKVQRARLHGDAFKSRLGLCVPPDPENAELAIFMHARQASLQDRRFLKLMLSTGKKTAGDIGESACRFTEKYQVLAPEVL